MSCVMCDAWCVMCQAYFFCKILTLWVKGRPKMPHLGSFRPFEWYSKFDPVWPFILQGLIILTHADFLVSLHSLFHHDQLNLGAHIEFKNQKSSWMESEGYFNCILTAITLESTPVKNIWLPWAEHRTNFSKK